MATNLGRNNNKRGKTPCSHIMAIWDPHVRCSLCRNCDLVQNPCKECREVAPEIRALLVEAHTRREKKLEKKARSRGTTRRNPDEGKTSRATRHVSPGNDRSTDHDNGSPSVRPSVRPFVRHLISWKRKIRMVMTKAYPPTLRVRVAQPLATVGWTAQP